MSFEPLPASDLFGLALIVSVISTLCWVFELPNEAGVFRLSICVSAIVRPFWKKELFTVPIKCVRSGFAPVEYHDSKAGTLAHVGSVNLRNHAIVVAYSNPITKHQTRRIRYVAS